MVLKKGGKLRMGTGTLLICGLVLSTLFAIFSIACQAPAPTPIPTPTPTPTLAPTPTPTPTTATLKISGFAFVPATITVAVGTTVTWTNQDAATHTVTTETDLFDSGNLSRNASFSYSFTESGTFKYYCTIHPSMRGTVIVE